MKKEEAKQETDIKRLKEAQKHLQEVLTFDWDDVTAECYETNTETKETTQKREKRSQPMAAH